MKCTFLLLLFVFCLIEIDDASSQSRQRSVEYAQVQKRLARGWNTWNTHSVLSHVLLPEGLAVNLNFKESIRTNEKYLRDALIGQYPERECKIKPGSHAYDGSYTELVISWRSIEARVQSATTDEGDLVLLITPLKTAKNPPVLIAETGVIWNRPGYVEYDNNSIRAVFSDKTINIFCTGETFLDPNVPVITPYLAMYLDSPVGISTGKSRTIGEISVLIDKQRDAHNARVSSYGALADVYAAVQTVMGWNMIYDPQNDRVMSTVSRIWNQNRGGWALFCWDTFFAAYMAAIDFKDLAYANAREIMNEKTEKGFVPNNSQGNGRSSLDRSQPPVGSITVWNIYQKFGEKWFLEDMFDDLFGWNRWWDIYRNYDGLLCWGSNPYDDPWDDPAQGNLLAAALESGLDNSPMYDNVPFNEKIQIMEMWDVGLNSLYIADCNVLAEIAKILERKSEEKELLNRAAKYTKNMERLWDEETGLYLNVRTDTAEVSKRISPIHFYPLLATVPSEKRAKEMIDKHFYNTNEFWGEWVLPSIARNDSAFNDNDYWRGRIWAPLNFLVYLGLRNYDLSQARQDLAEKSKNLLLKGWLENGHVYENYNAVTGEGADVINSDRFYLWGGLLGLIAIIEEGYFDRMGK